MTVMRARSRDLRVVGALLIGAVLLQIGHWHQHGALGMPLAAATSHNAGAALLACVRALLRLLWPDLEAGVIPLRDVHRTR